MATNTISQETKEFIDIFKFSSQEEVIPWINKDSIGFSVIKEYPEKSSFVPAKNAEGKMDSVTLIKIGYDNENNAKVPLRVNIHKASRYLLNGHWNYNYEDKNSPTEESLKESKESKQPIDLEDLSRYIFNTTTKKLFDKEKNKYISPKEIIEDIYETHLQTLKNRSFRAKMAIKNNISSFVDPINRTLKWTNFFLFGKQLKETSNFSTGIFQTYAYSDLISLTTEKTKILGSDFPVTNQTARTFVVILVFIFLINYFLKFDIFGLVNILNESSKNSLFLAALIAVMLYIFDRVLPNFILFLINCFIKLRLKIWNWKVQIKSTTSTDI